MQSIHSAASQISCSLSKDQQPNQRQKGCAKNRRARMYNPSQRSDCSSPSSPLFWCSIWSLGNENDLTQRKRLFGWYQRWFQLHAVDMVHLLLNLCLHSSHAVASTFLGLDLCPCCPQSVCAHDGLAAHLVPLQQDGTEPAHRGGKPIHKGTDEHWN